jgi:hypothetical protein
MLTIIVSVLLLFIFLYIILYDEGEIEKPVIKKKKKKVKIYKDTRVEPRNKYQSIIYNKKRKINRG